MTEKQLQKIMNNKEKQKKIDIKKFAEEIRSACDNPELSGYFSSKENNVPDLKELADCLKTLDLRLEKP